MLQSIRDRTQGLFAGIVISLLILSFALWGIHSYLVGGSETTVIAKVNGAEISKSQLAVAYDRLRRQLQMQFSSNYGLPEGAEAALKEKALQTLINIQVLSQASLAQDYRISDQQVDNLLESMPEFQVNSRFSLARFQQVLSTTLFNPGDFLQLLKTSLLIDQPRLGMVFTSIALPDEVSSTIALVNQEREIKYATFAVQDFLSQPMTIAQTDIDAYYKAHEKDFRTQEQVSVQYIQLSVKDLMAGIHPTDAELKKYYNENSTSLAQPMQWQLQTIFVPLSQTATNDEVTAAESKMTEISQKIAKGENFATFAHQYPADKQFPQLHQNWLAINNVPETLQKLVMTLTKVDQVSAPYRMENGFVIVKATAVKEPKVESFDSIKDKVQDALVRQQAEEKFASLRDKLASSTYEHPDSLEPAAQALNLKVQTTGVFTKEKGANDVSSNTKIREAAFNNDVMNAQNNSDVIQLSADSALVLRIKSHTPATLMPLKTVEQQITDKLKLQEAEHRAEKQAQDIKAKLASGASVDQVTNEYHLKWDNVGYIGRHATKVDSAVLNEAFSIAKPTQDMKTVYSTAKMQNGYAVIALTGVKNGAAAGKDEYDVFSEQVQSSQGMLEYELFKDSLMKQAKIVIETPSQEKTVDVG